MTATAPSVVKTGQVKRRQLHFSSVEDVIAEAQRIADADKAGTAHTLGNWSPGTILNHIAVWAEFAFTGNPIKPPFIMRMMGPMLLNHFLKKGLPAGHSIPKVPGGTLGSEPASVDQALPRLKSAFIRLKNENTPAARHALFGKMTHDQYIALNLRHAELHMSFVTY